MALKWHPYGRPKAKVSPNEMAKLLVMEQMGRLGYLADPTHEMSNWLWEATEREKEEVYKAVEHQSRRVRKLLGQRKLDQKIRERKGR